MLMSKLCKASIFPTDEFVTYMAFHAFLIFHCPKKATILLIVVPSTEAYSGPTKTCKIECFAKIITILQNAPY